MNTFIFSLGLSIFIIQLSVGQNPKFNNPLILPDNTNAFSGRTLQNELLLSSLNGWVKYDGLRSEIFDIHKYPQLIDHNIQSDFFTATDGKVWFCSYQALICFDPIENTFEQKQLRKKGELLESDYYVFHLENDTLFGSIGNELFIFNTTTGETKFFDINFERHWVKYTRIKDEIHFLNFFKGNSTYHYILDAKTFELKSKNTLPFRTDDLINNKNFHWILATENGLVNYNIISKTITPIYNELREKLLISVEALNENQWLCTDNGGGIYLIENDNVKKIDNLLLGNPTVQHIWYYDGKVILSSFGNGVFIFSRNFILFDRFSFPLKYYPQNIFSLKNSLFITSKEYPALKYNYDDKTLLNGFTLNKGRIMHSSLCKDGIIFSIDNGNVVFNNKDSEFPIIFSKQIKRIKHIQYHASNDIFTVATMKEMVYLGTIENKTFILSDSIKVDSSGKGIGSVIFENDFLIASINDQFGAVYKKENENYRFIKKIELQGSVDMNVLDNNRNCIWIATQYGLKKYNFKENSLEQVTHSYANRSIEGLLMDNLSRLWFSTDNGLFLYDPNSELIDKFGVYDGLPDVKFTSNTACKLPNGKFLFGGSFGWVEFYPEDFNISIEKPNIVLRQTLLNDNVPVALNGKKFLSMGPEVNAFSFEFAATTLLNGEDNNVKYRLYPEDEHFVETGAATGFARYTHLKPGNYEFQILAADEAGRWSEDGYNIQLEVLPPWWETWWFRILAIITILTLIYLSVRDYYKRQLARKDIQLREQKLTIEKQEAIQRERTRIAGEMHDDLGSGLTTIQYLSERALKNVNDEKEIQNIRKISKESNDLVRNMSEIIWAMNDRFDTLDNLIIYIRRYAYEFLDSHGLAFNIHIQENIPGVKISGEKRRNVFLVVKEALHNVVKHSKATLTNIEVTFDEELVISIKDNGTKGMVSEDEQNGNGLHNMQNRMKKVGGTCEFITEQGWEVRITLPFHEVQI